MTRKSSVEQVLEEIGLTKSEISVYLALLELGSCSSGKIVDKSKTSSSKIYEVLERLMQKGLVSFIIKGGVKHFEATSVERLMDYLSEKKQNIETQSRNLEAVLPALLATQQSATSPSEATIFKGFNGAKTAFDEVITSLDAGDSYCAIAGGEQTPIFNRFFSQYHRRRSTAGIKVNLILKDNMREWGKTLLTMQPTEIRYIANDVFANSILIYKDIALITVLDQDDMTVFKIQNKRVVASFQKQFDSLWNQEVKTHRGLGAVERFFDEMLDAGHCDLIGARGYFMDARPVWIKKWAKRAEKKGFTIRNIVDPDVKGHYITTLPFIETKYTLQKEFVDLSVYWIYGGKVIMTNWDGDEPILIEMNIPRIVDVYKKQFEMLWRVK